MLNIKRIDISSSRPYHYNVEVWVNNPAIGDQWFKFHASQNETTRQYTLLAENRHPLDPPAQPVDDLDGLRKAVADRIAGI